MQRQWRLFASALTLVLFAALAMTPSSPATAQDDGSGNLVGSWIGTITVDTPSGTPPFAFADLISINRGGTLTGTNGNAHSSQFPFAPPVDRVDASDFFGSWKPIGGSNQFAATVKWLLFLGPQSPPNPAVTAVWCPGTTCFPGPYPGQNIGVATLQDVVTLEHTKSSDTFSGPWTLQLTNLRDDVVATHNGTLFFSRIAIEPLMP